MANAERPNLFQRTIGSEGFERFSRKPIGVITAIFLISVGLGSVEGIIEAIDQEKAQVATSYGIQAGLELGTVGAIAFANLRSRIKSKHPLSPERSGPQLIESQASQISFPPEPGLNL